MFGARMMKFQGKIGVCSNTQEYGPVCPPWQGPRGSAVPNWKIYLFHVLPIEWWIQVGIPEFISKPPKLSPKLRQGHCKRYGNCCPGLGSAFLLEGSSHLVSDLVGGSWWFQTVFFIFHNIRDNPSHWLIFFKMAKTTNQWLVAGTKTQLCVPLSWSTKISLSTVFVQAWQVSPACNSGSDYERICVPGLKDLGEHGRTESAVSRIPHHLGMG